MRERICTFWRCRKASVLPLTGFAAIIVAGAAALSIDMGIAYFEKSDMQKTADAAALAAAGRLPDDGAAQAMALAYTEKNMPAALHGTVLTASDIAIGNWDSTSKSFQASPYEPKAVKVTVRKTEAEGNAPSFAFGKVLGFKKYELSASSVAGISDSLCLLVLDPEADKAMNVLSNGHIDAPNCAAWVNSLGSQALVTESNSEIHFSQTCVAGGHEIDYNAIYTAPPKANCAPRKDPLAEVPEPDSFGCDFNNTVLNHGTHALNPGIYCGGLKIKPNAVVTLSPGTYVMKDGLFEMSSNTSLSGEKVTLYLKGDKSRMVLRSNSTLSLSAPSEGPQAGIAIFEDRAAPLLRNHELASNGVKSINGVIYLSRGVLDISSNVEVLAESAFTSVIVRQLHMASNARMGLNTDFEKTTAANISPNIVHLLK